MKFNIIVGRTETNFPEFETLQSKDGNMIVIRFINLNDEDFNFLVNKGLSEEESEINFDLKNNVLILKFTDKQFAINYNIEDNLHQHFLSGGIIAFNYTNKNNEKFDRLVCFTK